MKRANKLRNRHQQKQEKQNNKNNKNTKATKEYEKRKIVTAAVAEYKSRNNILVEARMHVVTHGQLLLFRYNGIFLNTRMKVVRRVSNAL